MLLGLLSNADSLRSVTLTIALGASESASKGVSDCSKRRATPQVAAEQSLSVLVPTAFTCLFATTAPPQCSYSKKAGHYSK